MEKITPFKNEAEALATLDNGGRFYNILTKAKDDIITPQEVRKVAGVFFEPQQTVLFLELAMSLLNETEKTNIKAKFDNNLKEAYNKFKPKEITAAPADMEELVGTNVVISGVPVLTESATQFSGFIMVPAGKAFTMIPIIESYDLYEIRNQQADELFIIAHKKGKEKLPEQFIRIGGVVKEVRAKKEEETATNRFLEITYYITES
jgi:hypothetical protein